MHVAPVSVPRFAAWRGRKFAAVTALFAALALCCSAVAAPSAGARASSGKISVTTQPVGAAIFIDGQASGKAPVEIEGLGPGRYFLRAELDGYRAGEAVVEVSSNQNSPSVTIELPSTSAPRRVEPTPMPQPRPSTPIPAPVPLATPAPVAVAPPRATPPPATPAPAPAPEAAGESDETILRLVETHLKAITDGDIDAYVDLCAPKIDLYDEGAQTREAVRKSRQKLKERWPVYVISNVRDVAVRAADQPGVKRAAVTYDWNVSNPKTGKSASGTANDLLDFKQIGGKWLIVKARQNVDRKKKSGQ